MGHFENAGALIVENSVINNALLTTLPKNADIKFDYDIQHILYKNYSQKRQYQPLIKINDELETNLLIGADGANSAIKQKLNFRKLFNHDYKSRAVCALLKIDQPHNNIAWQRFLTYGPIALLPLSDNH